MPGLFALLLVKGNLSCAFQTDGREAEASPEGCAHAALLRHVRATPSEALRMPPKDFDEKLARLVEWFAAARSVDGSEVKVVAAEVVTRAAD